MKKIAIALVIAFTGIAFSGCATLVPIGSAYTGVKIPNNIGDGKDVSHSKVGVSKAISILGMVAIGDAGIEAAVKAGNIKTIKYVDWNVNNILGIYGEYTTTVYGD
jgi:uncharacterized protein YceK